MCNILGVIFFPCGVVDSGTNVLSTTTKFFAGFQSDPIFDRTRSEANIRIHQVRHYYFGVPGGAPFVLSSTIRVRGAHEGSGTGGSDSKTSCAGSGC